MKKTRWKIMPLVLLLVCSTIIQNTYAQDAPPVKFEHVSTRDGLSHSNAFSVLQDRGGFLRIWTINGLNRFDPLNERFIVYRNDEGVALKITSLAPWRQIAWLRGTLILAALGLLFGVYRWRIYAIQRRNRKLKRQVARRSRQLSESEIRFRELFENMSSGVAIYEAVDGGNDFVFRKFNRAAERLEGVQRQDVLGRRVTKIFPGVKALGLFTAFQRVWRTGNPEYLPANLYRDAQKISWRENHIYKLPSGQLVTIYNDLTEQKQSRIERDLLFNLSVDMLCIAGFDGYLKQINPAWSMTLGWPEDELLRHPWLYFVHPDDQQSTQDIRERLFAGEDVHDFHNRYRCQDGTFRWIAWNVKPLSEQELLFGVARDISKQKRTEEALFYQREVAESLQEVATALNRNLHLEKMLPSISEQMQRVIPHDSGGLFLREDRQLVLFAAFKGKTLINHPVGKPINLGGLHPIAKVFHQRRPLVLADVRQKAEWQRWPETEQVRSWMAAPLILEEEVIGVLTADRYVPGAYTEEDGRHLQAFASQVAVAVQNARLFNELHQAKAQADAANQAKSRFLTNMSHELRTPLNAILGFSHILLHESHTTEERESLEIIQHSGEHLLSLINQVLDLSKIEAERVVINQQSVHLPRFLDELEDMFSLKAREKNLTLHIERSAALPEWIRTDALKIRQIFINLLNNAVKFTQNGGVFVKIIPSQRKKQNHEADESSFPSSTVTLLCSVSDTGAGIAEEELHTLFEPFTQTASGRTAREGTGLGLAISQKFVQLLGGEIRVKSEVGKGSAFTFDIAVEPVESAEHVVQENRRVVGVEAGRVCYRILIVDDNAENRKLLVKSLNFSAFDVQEAENGEVALRRWKEWAPHLLLLDLWMPLMDGYEAVQAIRKLERMAETDQGGMQRREFPQTKIIAVSASCSEEERKRALLAGCNDFLCKPFTQNVLFEKLQKHLELRLTYKDETTPAPSVLSEMSDREIFSALADVPEELLRKLKFSLTITDMMSVKAIIGEMRAYQPEVAERFRQYAENFDYLSILAYLQRETEAHS